jgi:hypothetical protein
MVSIMKGDLQTSLVDSDMSVKEVVIGNMYATRVMVGGKWSAVGILCWHGRETPPSFDYGIFVVNGDRGWATDA